MGGETSDKNGYGKRFLHQISQTETPPEMSGPAHDEEIWPTVFCHARTL
jgi:hypothetical protein